MPKDVQIGVRLTPAMHKKAQEKAESEGIALATWVRKVIEDKLKDPPIEEQINELRQRIERLEKKVLSD